MNNYLKEWINFLNEDEPYQKSVNAKHSKNKLTTKGSITKEPPFVQTPPKERARSAPPLGEQENKEQFKVGDRVEIISYISKPGVIKIIDGEKIKVQLDVPYKNIEELWASAEELNMLERD